MKSATQGGHSILYAGLSPEFEGQSGTYTDNSQVSEPSQQAKNPSWQKFMWDSSLKLTGLETFIDEKE